MTTLRPGEHPDELISASLTGDLSEAEQSQLTRHLADCAHCRDTLAAFDEERRLISGMRHVPPPRDLGARVRAGIESGRAVGLPWWRRPMFLGIAGSVATVAAAVLAIVILNSQPSDPPVGQATPTASASEPASTTAEPSASVDPSLEPIPTPTVNPQAFLRPGELGYFSMVGDSMETPRLAFIKNDTGEAVEADTPAGPPIGAALSPDAEWVAYITEIGESGANQVWGLHLTDGETVRLGCANLSPFADRLLWSGNSQFLVFTIPAVPAEMTETIDCGLVAPGPTGSTDVWAFDTHSGAVMQVTDSGDAFAADIIGQDLEGGTSVLVSHAAESPWTEQLRLPEPLEPDAEPLRIDGMFLPLMSPIPGGPAVYWTGSMSQASQDGRWQFTTGGMPEVGSLNYFGAPDDGSPLFADLSANGGGGFQDGHFGWGADGDLITFWGGLWIGAPQGDDYPSEKAVYAGRLTDGGLMSGSRLDIPTDGQTAQIISVEFEPDGVRAVVSVRDFSAGVGDPASANLYLVPIGGGEAILLGGGIDPPPWDGPAVYGQPPTGFPF